MKRAVIFLIAAATLLSALTLTVSAEDAERGYFTVSAVNAYPRPAAITIMTPAHSTPTTDVSESLSVLEITVENDKVTAVGGNNSAIPSDGFVIVVRGSELQRQIKDTGIKEGDSVMFDEDNKRLYILNDSYDPFYSVTISFDGFNGTRTADTIKIYNTGKSSGTNIWGSEAVVGADGTVMSVGGNDNTIPEGGYVVSAVGRERIAELENAAKVGMTATVDKDAKTVTFEYGKNSVINSMKAGLAGFTSALADAKAAYANINYTTCANLEKELGALVDRASLLLDGGDTGGAILAERDFNRLLTPAMNATVENPAAEARALWLRPENSGSREAVNKIVRDIYEMGFNTVCIELMYDSTMIFPIDTDKYEFSQNPSLNGFDVLAAYIDECHKYGIEVNGWMSVYRVGYETSKYASLSVAAKHEDWRCIAKSGINYVYNIYGNGWFLNPALSEVRELLLNMYGYVLDNYDLDGFQLDYVRYPYTEGEMYGYDEYTLSQFESQYGKNPKDMGTSDALWTDWCKFRAKYVTDFVREIKALVEEKRPDMYLSADVAPDFRDVYKKYMQEAEIWLTEGIVDVEYPMAYGTNVIPLYASFTIAAAGDTGYSYIGLGDYGADVFKRQITECRAAGSDGIAFFSYAQYTDGNYKDALASTILSKKSLSPTYDASAALKAQINYALDRAQTACDLSDDALSLDTIDLIIDGLSKIYLSEETDPTVHVAALTKLLGDLEGAEGDSPALSAISTDIKKALKIATLSRDAAKDEYRKTHPLPELYDLTETSGDESSEPESSDDTASSEQSAASETASDTISEAGKSGDNGKIGIIIGICAAAAAVAAAAVIIIRRKKHGNKTSEK